MIRMHVGTIDGPSTFTYDRRGYLVRWENPKPEIIKDFGIRRFPSKELNGCLLDFENSKKWQSEIFIKSEKKTKKKNREL